ncbi:MAG: hypothetical protein WCE30_16610 [Mycobacterium sp.]
MTTTASAAPSLVSTDVDPTAFDCPGEVHVRVRGLLSANAICSCGWHGHRRHLKASAEFDAWEHAMHTPCSVSFPLLSPW